MNLNEVILAQRKGAFILEAQESLQRIVKAVTETGKKGVLKITLEIEPSTDDTIVIHDNVTEKMPKPNRLGSTFYPLEDGSLSREDPEQGEFPAVKEAVGEK